MSRQLVVTAVVISLGLAAFGGGCSALNQPFPEKSSFAIQAPPPPRAVGEAATPSALRVQAVRAAKPFDSTEFLYRTGPSKFASDYYNGFIAPPERLLTADLTRWLSASNVCSAVIEPGTSADFRYTLAGYLEGLYGDYTVSNQPAAIVKFKVYVLEDDPVQTKVKFQKVYEESEPLQGKSPADLVAAWERAWARVLTAIVADLRTAVRETTVTKR